MSLKDCIKRLIHGWLPSTNQEVRIVKYPLAGFSFASILIVLMLVLNPQVFFPPKYSPSESYQGIERLWDIELCDRHLLLSHYMSYISGIIQVSDINGDGISDIVAAAWDNNTYCFSGADGSILWKMDLGKGVRNVWAVPSQGDGGFDIVASTAMNDWDHNGETYLLNGKNGSIIWEFSKGSAMQLVPDINDDGIPEVLMENKGKEYYSEFDSLLIGTPTYYVSEYDSISLISGANGKEFWESPIGPNCSRIQGVKWENCKEKPNSGFIICYLEDPMYPYLISFDLRTSEKIWSYKVSYVPIAVVVAPIISKEDVIIGARDGAYLIDGSDGKVVWELAGLQSTEYVTEADVTQDINGDGINDIIFGSYQEVVGGLKGVKVRAVSGVDGSLIWEKFVEPAGNLKLGIALTTIQDLNKDGVNDIVFVTGTISQGFGQLYLYCISGTDGNLLGYCTFSSTSDYNELWYKGLTEISDVNGDGLHDIMFVYESQTGVVENRNVQGNNYTVSYIKSAEYRIGLFSLNMENH